MALRSTHFFRRRALAALVVVLAALVPALASPEAASAQIGEWRHGWEVVQLVRLSPPPGTPIFYLGDSTTRESVPDDAGWTRLLRREAAAAGRASLVRAFTIASHGQTFRMDRQFIDAMPPRPPHTPHGLALIGVGLSRFIGPPLIRPQARVTPPAPGEPPVLHPWIRHLYTTRPPLPLWHKQGLVPRWMCRRWAGFTANRRANISAIGRLVEACRAKGLRPVLVDMPLDVRVAGHGLDRARLSYTSACRRLASVHHIPYLTLAAPLPGTSDFWDLMHLLPPGSRSWESTLSRRVVRLLPPAPHTVS